MVNYLGSVAKHEQLRLKAAGSSIWGNSFQWSYKQLEQLKYTKVISILIPEDQTHLFLKEPSNWRLGCILQRQIEISGIDTHFLLLLVM